MIQHWGGILARSRRSQQMRTVFASLVVASLGIGIVLGQGQAQGQAQAPPATGLIVGSGNFFSPIVSDLDAATAFYRDGLGFAVTGAPSDATSNTPLRHMFGLPDARLRWNIARPSGMRGGVEIVEIKNVISRAAMRNVQDPGAVSLVLAVRDVDALLTRLLPLGASIVTTNGRPVDVTLLGAPARAALVKTPDGHFLQLVQRPVNTASDPASAVTDVRVRLTVEDMERTLKLYRDDLGVRVQSPGTFGGAPAVMQMLGLGSGQFRQAITQVPGSGLFLQFIEFKDVERHTVRSDIQDPGSTRIQLQVKDVDAAIKAVVGAGGRVVSTGARPVQLPAGRGGSIRAAVVRDPDNLFLVLIEQTQAR
jgi:predicted enzyme related to lactoylglutathione lyase